jgi:hypothetical protein
MVGLIWTIQRLHYPAFGYVSDDRFIKFHEYHSKNITFIVLPVMLLELATAILIEITATQSSIPLMNLILLILIWLCTFFVSVPIHNSLVRGKNPLFVERLILTNWLRTILWSLRLILLGYYCFEFFKIK